ncbi:MAG: tRNA (N(6)-L-threonylcarbamoyladenosine(37)-C(2))-methylthiotransferase MtaB [Geminicoccaceae bacterium]
MPVEASVEVVTFGCRLNTLESEAMRRLAAAACSGEMVIVHTCAVTAEAERQARQAIRRLRRTRPAARIVVTGCAVQLAPGAHAAMPEIDHLLGNAEKLRPESWATLDRAPRVRVGNIMAVREAAAPTVDGLERRTRGFLQVQQGCDHRCTFCSIPFGRGPSRSVPLAPIAAQARALLRTGHVELTVTGVDIASYGRDLAGSPSLGAMLKSLLAEVPELRRLRLSSLDPAAVDHDLLDLLAHEPRFLPHLHLSVQAGGDLVLKRMRRRHQRQDVIGLAAGLRALRPDLVLGADLIAGFPTEDEALFDDTVKLVEEADLTYLHVFPYSPRPGTPAARMSQLPSALRRERAARLRAVGERRLDRFLRAQLGRRLPALMERGGGGHTDQFAPFHIALGERVPPAGRVVELEVSEVQDGILLGRAA